tara:strand:+ start:5926 stop:6192 length:267 start_codon:yes stop_codon:yes gene_type:complete
VSTRSEREQPDYKITHHDLERISEGVLKRKKRADRDLGLVKSGGLLAYNPADYPKEDSWQKDPDQTSTKTGKTKTSEPAPELPSKSLQ